MTIIEDGRHLCIYDDDPKGCSPEKIAGTDCRDCGKNPANAGRTLVEGSVGHSRIVSDDRRN